MHVCLYVCESEADLFLQANEILMAGAKLSATEAYERGLVTRVFPKEELQQKLKETVQYIASLPPKVRLPSTLYIDISILQHHPPPYTHSHYRKPNSY